MTTDLLREAAALMRQRAQAVQSGPWHVQHIDPAIVGGDRTEHSWFVMERLPDGEGSRGPYADCCCQSSAEHIASWHPLVALAVADILEHEAAVEEQYGAPASTLAVAVARVYLGRDT